MCYLYWMSKCVRGGWITIKVHGEDQLSLMDYKNYHAQFNQSSSALGCSLFHLLAHVQKHRHSWCPWFRTIMTLTDAAGFKRVSPKHQPAGVFVRWGVRAGVETREEAWASFHWALQRRLGWQHRRLKITDYWLRFHLYFVKLLHALDN